jgi:hypothetical protein
VLITLVIVGVVVLVVLAVLIGLALRQDDEIRSRPGRHDREPD